MKQQKSPSTTLSDFINSLQSQGRYTFSRPEAIEELNLSATAFKFALNRLLAKKRVARIRNGFYSIVPLEYQNGGAPPASWFIDELMQFQQQPYYVSLLSAAALHGAAHQSPQEFQVITDKPLRSIIIGNQRVCFFKKRTFANVATELVKTPTGYMKVATPETTAFDLVRYLKSAGYFNHVATVLSELLEKLNAENLLKVAQAEKVELSVIQRLGFLLDFCGGEGVTSLLAQWISEQAPRAIALNPNKPIRHSEKNKKWRIYINENVEIDE